MTIANALGKSATKNGFEQLYKPRENVYEKLHKNIMNLGPKHRNELNAYPLRPAEWMIFNWRSHQHDEQDEEKKHGTTQ